MNQIKLSELLKLARPGDIGLSENPDGLGKGIKWFQELGGDEAKYTHAFIFRAPIVRTEYLAKELDKNGKPVTAKIAYEEDVLSEQTRLDLAELSPECLPSAISDYIYESYKKITINHLKDYLNKNILVMRHRRMTFEKYKKGVKEIKNNLGQIYPYHRLILHGIDSGLNWVFKRLHVKPLAQFAKWLSTDWPVCSELAVQFLLEAGVKTHLANGEKWQGVQPDDLHDVALTHPNKWEIVFEGKLIEG